MKKKNIVKIFALAVLVILVIVASRLVTRTSYGADNEEKAILEGAFNKYVNYELTDGTKATLVQYSLRTGIEYGDEFYAIRNSEISVALNQIDGKYPTSVKVIGKSTKVTNGKTTDINEDYSYDSNTGIVTIRTSNENENGDPIYNAKPAENDRDEYIVISYYDTYTQDKPERELSCNVSYKAVLFTDDNKEVTGEGNLDQKVTEDVGELTSVNTNTSDVYNGYIKSNIINGTAYDTEYTENNEIMISDKRAHQKINITEENSFVAQNDIYYKSTKILKDDILNVLGENGSLEILDGNNNVVATIDNNTEFNENGEYIVTYGDDVNSITIKTSNVTNEGILNIENVKRIKSDESNIDDKDITRKVTIVGINEKEEQVNVDETINYLQNGNLNLNSVDNNVTTGENEGNNVATQIVEEESYRNEKENTIEIKDATTNIELNVDNTNWTNEKQNEVTFDISLNSSNIKDNLFVNPSVRITLPSEVEKVILNDSQIMYGNGLELQQPYTETDENGNINIVANLTGKQTQYDTNNLGLTTNVKISGTIILKKDISNASEKMNLTYTNGYTLDGSAEQGNIEKQVQISTYNADTEQTNQTNDISQVVSNTIENVGKEASTIATMQNVDGLELTVEPVKGDTILKDGDSVYEGEFIKYNITIKNNSDNDLTGVKVVGNIPDGVTYGELDADYYNALSYYRYNYDSELKQKEIDVGDIKSGESISEFYEVKVNDLADGTEELPIDSTIDLYVDTQEVTSYEIKNTVKPAELSVFLKSETDHTPENWNYDLIFTGEAKDATVKVQLPEEYTAEYYMEGELGLLSEITEDQISEDNVLTLNVNTANTYRIFGTIKNVDVDTTGNLSTKILQAVATVNVDGNEYKSNENRIEYSYENLSITMTSNNEGEEVKYGDIIEYTISIKNIGRKNTNELGYDQILVNLKDYLPEEVEPVDVTYMKQEYAEDDSISSEEEVTEDISGTVSDDTGKVNPNVDLMIQIPYQETRTVVIRARAGYVEQETKIENTATIDWYMNIFNGTSEGENEENQGVLKTKDSNTITHIIVPQQEEPEGPEDPDNPDPDNPDPDNPDPDNPNPDNPDTELYNISGIAWLDENEDGQRQESEQRISGIQVSLVDAETGNVVSDKDNNNMVTTTTANGTYSFSNVKTGNYIVAFNYDTQNYSLTTYRKSGVNSEINSDVTDVTAKVDGVDTTVAATDIINVNTNTSNIDIGLVSRKTFDFKLDKSVKRVSLETKNGTKEVDYGDSKLAKIDIRAKEIAGSKITVEYEIVITNEGEVEGSVDEVVDYLPEGFTFSTQQNKDWAASADGKITNSSYTNQKIQPGQSITLSVILTKQLTEDDLGTYVNKAELSKVSNSRNLSDIDSTPGNNNAQEDDYSEASLIISLHTGLVTYICIGFGILAILGLGIFLIRKYGIKKVNKFMVLLVMFATLIISQNSRTIAYSPTSTTFSNPDQGTYFSGGPMGMGGDCVNHGVWAYSGGYTLYSTSRTNVRTTYGPNNAQFTLSGNTNQRLDLRLQGSNYVVGPFQVNSTSYENGYNITVYGKNGGAIYTTFINGGSTTFYLSIPASSCAAAGGISSVKLHASKTATRIKYCSQTEYGYFTAGSQYQRVKARYPYTRTWQEEEEITVEKELVWRLFNASLDLEKIDYDDDTVRIDISGVLSGPSGTIEFTTTDGRYHFDNLIPGTYTITETINNNYGYEENVNTTINVSLGSGSVITAQMKNIKYTGNIKIVKKDKDTGRLMSGVSFKLQAAEGYVIGIDDSGNPIRQATGSAHFSNMEYTSDISQATEFITDGNGEVEIYNIRIGTYTVIEYAINTDRYGYELDDNYIFWSSSIGSGEHTSIGQVEVVRKPSYVTTPKRSVSDSDFDIITFENRRKWIKLSGNVWEDMISGKTSERDYLYTANDSTENNPDKLVANVTVRLKDRNGNTIPFRTQEDGPYVNEVLTDENGHYLMVDVLIDDIPNYYIEFSYNGMSYTSVPIVDTALNAENYNGTRAIENAGVRAEFNRKYSEITHSGNTGPVGESRDDSGSKTYDLNYDQGEYSSSLNYGPNALYGYDGQKFPVNNTYDQYMITATTRDAFMQVGDDGYLDYIKTPEEIRQQEIEEIEDLNLGLEEREQPDLALVEDIETVTVSLNNYDHTYNYNQRFENQDQYGDGFNVAVKFGNEYGSAEYTQPIYSSDVVYNAQPGNEGKLEIYVRYKIALRNEATNLYTRVNNVIAFYDNRYTIDSIQDDNGSTYNYTDEGTVGDYKKATIEAVNQDLEPQSVKYVYITYKLNNDAINAVLNNNNEFEENPLDAVAEIGSYSTYSDSGFSVHYAGVDKDSRPGSAEPADRSTFEDDTDSAPAFKLELKEGRVIAGTVWEDEAVQELLNNGTQVVDSTGNTITMKERIGNGLYDEGTENTIGNVTVDLIVLSYDEESEVDLANANILGEAEGTESEIAKLYQGITNADAKEVDATMTTGSDGHYEFSGVIPGKYLLRFTYGNESVIYNPDGTENRKIEDVDKYKSTIYRGNRPENQATAAGDTDWWYRSETSGEEGAQRWSDARDEIGIDGNGKFDLLAERNAGEREYYYGNTSPDVINNVDTIRNIEARSRGFEIKEDYDVNLDNMSKFGEDLKFVFDNIDFGIIRRPIQKLNVEKQIAYVKVTLANGQVLIEGDPRVDQIEHLRFLPDGNVHIEVDSEIIQGATLTVRYEIIADNTDSELDYSDDNYYIFGIQADSSKLIAPKVKRLHDYLSNDLVFNKENSPDWNQYESGELEQLLNDQYLSQDAYDTIKSFNQILWTNAFENMGVGRYTTTLEVSKVLSNSADDFVFDNDIEVNILKGRRTTKPDDPDDYTIPGDYIPSDSGRIEGGDDSYVTLTITPPTGEDLGYIPYIVLGISAFIILGVGVIFIKKKVLK